MKYNIIDQLYTCAAECRFLDFENLYDASQSLFTPQEHFDALLMRAQIKLLTADETVLCDLMKIGNMRKSTHKCLFAEWKPITPNRFSVFCKSAGYLKRFLDLMPKVKQLFMQYFGLAGSTTVSQVQGEILFFLGRAKDAIKVVEDELWHASKIEGSEILAGYLLFRCNLSLGNADEARKNMMEMIRHSKAGSVKASAYRVVRKWANLVTGWSGDTPRYRQGGDSQAPVLDERISAINAGIATYTKQEKSFIEYAAKSYRGGYTMKQHYMDIFYAIYWFGVGNLKQSEHYFTKAYNLSVNTGIVMAFAEYGSQLNPIFDYLKENPSLCPQKWLDDIQHYATMYEDGINKYRQ